MTIFQEPAKLFVEVLLPIPLEKPFTYVVPEALHDHMQFGCRVEVQFGKSKRYSAIVVNTTDQEPGYRTKAVIDLIDEEPLIDRRQYQFWQWLADYYCCTVGEVMAAALPSNFKLSSETVIFALESAPEPDQSLSDKAFMLVEALQNNKSLSLETAQQLLGVKAVLPIVHDLFRRGYIGVEEHLVERYKPQLEKRIRLTEYYLEDEERLHEALDLAKRSEKQTRALLAYIQLSRDKAVIPAKTLQQKATVDLASLKALQKKGVFEIFTEEVNRISLDPNAEVAEFQLSPAQKAALESIRLCWEEKTVTLLHGATGSGKTWIYKQIIQDNLAAGNQTLYLLPEIALTVQLVRRLQEIFGQQIVVAHSGLNNNERADLWKRVREGAPIIMGVRSSIFLPYKNLTSIIVDEEHDNSYKQSDPAPRYNGRDAAIYLATLWGAKTLLGTATPAIETYFNARQGKYGLVNLRQRYSEAQLPVLKLVDLKKKRLTRQSQFSSVLIEGMTETLQRSEQVIVFKNRRGYAPVVRCEVCGWQSMCERCDVAMTYHKSQHDQHCHMCGLKSKVPLGCPACGSSDIRFQGYGTQKIEDELKIIFPDAKVARMDHDTTRQKQSYHKLITSFERQEVDILVGTQMVTKGLDFDHVGLVGVIHADQQLFFPHYRAVERTFQLLVQVSGRAGRKHAAGDVIIQTYHPTHPVFADVAFNDYESFYTREIEQRRIWKYPPYVYLVKLILKHTKQHIVHEASLLLAHRLRSELGDRILGPAEPHIARVRNQYIMEIGIKTERSAQIASQVKKFLRDQVAVLRKEKGFSGVRVNIDVDPS